MAREAIGVDPEYPYSHAIKADGFVYIKSHVGIDPATDAIPPGISDQTRLTLDWLVRVLTDAGGTVTGLVKVNAYLAHIEDDFEEFDRTYNMYLKSAGFERPPARTTVGVPLSWPTLRVQMDAIAVE